MTKPANMTDLTERLRAMSSLQHSDYTIGDEAADEITRLQATVAGLRKSAALRVQFHAAELADVTAERDMWKDTLAQRDRELVNARAIDIHSCGPTCTRAGCVAAGLRAELGSLISQFHHATKDAGWHPGRTDDNLCDIIREKGKEMALIRAELIARRMLPSERLHNLCEGIADHADGSEWSREEWQRIDAENTGLREDAERFISLAEAMIADDDTQDTILDLLTAANPDPRTIDEVRAAIDAARKAAP